MFNTGDIVLVIADDSTHRPTKVGKQGVVTTYLGKDTVSVTIDGESKTYFFWKRELEVIPITNQSYEEML